MRTKPIFTMAPNMERFSRRAMNSRFARPDAPVDGQEAVETLMDAFGEFKDAHDSRLAAMQTQLDRVETVQNRPNLFGGTSTGGSSPRQATELNKAFRQFARTGDESRLNAMTTQSDPDGGYLIIPERSREMTTKLWDLSPMRRLARVITLTSSGTFEEPIDKDDAEATWCGETEDRSEDATPQLGLLTIGAKESYALVPISQKLLDDADIDLWSWMVEKLTGKFARQEGTAFITGVGDPSQPSGILTYPTATTGDNTRAWGTIQYVPGGSATTITSDALIDLVYSLRAPYRTGAAWLMNSDSARIISKLKDGSGDYLWRQSLASGQPDALCGFPVEYSEDMPAIAGDAFPIAFGNWRLGYTIIDRLGIRFLRDPYSKKPYVLVYAYRRVGGGVNNSEAIKLLKISTS